jgi:hypothetical protein
MFLFGSHRLDSGATFTGPSGIASISGGKYLVIGSATPGSPLFSLDPSENFYRETIGVALLFPIGNNIRFLSNYDSTTIFVGQGTGTSTDIYFVEVDMSSAPSPSTRIHQMPSLSHVSEGLAFYPLQSHPSDSYEDVSGPGERALPLIGMLVCVAVMWLA